VIIRSSDQSRRFHCLTGKKSGFSAIVLFVAGILFWGGFNTAMEATNTLEFCISCHEMESTVYQEYRQSVHHYNGSGVQATCSDCHVPKEWTAKLVRKIKASRELYHWATGAIDSREKFEAKRLQLAERVWHSMQESDSRECRNCHHFDDMDLAAQARFAARIHRESMNRNETCIDCHQGLVHQLPRQLQAEQQAPVLSADDREYAEEINDTCAGCHGQYGEGSLDGEYPRLAGLDRQYIISQIKHFKSRKRLNLPMLPYATERELPGDDTAIIATYLANMELPVKLPPVDETAPGFNAFERLKASEKVLNIARYPGDTERGGRLYRKECAGCHGREGLGLELKSAPRLTGQHSLYLKRQLTGFRNAERLHDAPEDAEIFKAFSDQEVDDLLAWLSTQDEKAVDVSQSKIASDK